MPSFKNTTAGVVASQEVASYVPLNFDTEVSAKPVQSFDFIERQKMSGKEHFEIDPRIAESIGLTEAKNKEQKKQFDTEVMRYVQKIKDGAYEEAYKKGLEQGVHDAKEKAYNESLSEIQNKVKNLIEMSDSLVNSRQKMFELNEQEIIQFCYYMAEKIVYRELKKDPTLITDAIKSITAHQENFVIKLSPTDYIFIQPHLDELAAELNLEKLKIEKDEALSSGDIVVDSEQGIVDGTLKTRLSKLKSLLDRQES